MHKNAKMQNLHHDLDVNEIFDTDTYRYIEHARAIMINERKRRGRRERKGVAPININISIARERKIDRKRGEKGERECWNCDYEAYDSNRRLAVVQDASDKYFDSATSPSIDTCREINWRLNSIKKSNISTNFNFIPRGIAPRVNTERGLTNNSRINNVFHASSPQQYL